MGDGPAALWDFEAGALHRVTRANIGTKAASGKKESTWWWALKSGSGAARLKIPFRADSDAAQEKRVERPDAIICFQTLDE
jgi:hypothetical protein